MFEAMGKTMPTNAPIFCNPGSMPLSAQSKINKTI